MREAGGLDTLQIDLRGQGIPFMGVIAVFQDSNGNTPDADDSVSVAASLLDLGDDGDMPVIAVSAAALTAGSPFDGQHPGRTIVAPDGTIVAHFGGHGNEGRAKAALIEHWEAQ